MSSTVSIIHFGDESFAGEWGRRRKIRETAKEEEEEERGESLPLSTMNSIRNPVLPVSDPPLDGENDSDGKGVDDRLFKGSAMTKRGAYAAVSYMTCAGNFPQISIVSHIESRCFGVGSQSDVFSDSISSLIEICSFWLNPLSDFSWYRCYRDEKIGFVCVVD